MISKGQLLGKPPLEKICRARACTHCAGRSLSFVLAEIDTELLELAIQVRALETRLFRDARHAAILTREVIFEVSTLERVARIAQRDVERDRRRLRSQRAAAHAIRRQHRQRS